MERRVLTLSMLVSAVPAGWLYAGILEPGTASAKRRALSASKGKRNMTILRINIVLKISDGQVDTDRSGALLCTDAALLRDLAFYLGRRLPASLEFDVETRLISAVGSAPIDVLLAVSAADAAAESVSVHLMKRPTLLYLSKGNSRFTELHALLDSAASQKKTVAIGVLPGGNIVEDVRVDDWQR